MNKIEYYIKQILPLKYYSKCRVQTDSGSIPKLAVWTQWFGKPFNVKWFTLAD